MNKRIYDLLDNGWDIKDTGYDEKPQAIENQKSYYVKSDTKGLRMWVLLEKRNQNRNEQVKGMTKLRPEDLTMVRPEDLTMLRCKKEFGIWYYNKVNPSYWNDLDAPIYNLYNEDSEFRMTFGCYNDMKTAVESRRIEI